MQRLYNKTEEQNKSSSVVEGGHKKVGRLKQWTKHTLNFSLSWYVITNCTVSLKQYAEISGWLKHPFSVQERKDPYFVKTGLFLQKSYGSEVSIGEFFLNMQ